MTSNPWNIIFSTLLFVYFVNDATEASGPGQCCYASDDHQCKNTCEKMFRNPEPARTSGITARQISRLSADCNLEQVNFWSCINYTNSGEQWVGRRCCEFALASQCRINCQKARSRDDLRDSCRMSDEVAVIRCVDRQEEGHRCCRSANAQCSAVCKRIFYQDSAPLASDLDIAEEHCEQAVISCLQSGSAAPSRHKPTDSLMCCNQSEVPQCRTKCHEALQLLVSEYDIIDEVSKHCGSPNVAVPLWQCFLRTSTHNIRRPDRHEDRSHNMAGGGIEVTGIDSAKLQCCDKAATDYCKDLCKKTYSKQWTENVGQFHSECTSYNTNEYKLAHCLEDVDDQCEFGCSGLNFCTNFNNRPTTLFRSCTREADAGAKAAMELWRQGLITLPNLIGNVIPVKDTSTCQPEKWKAIACTLQIRPCHSQSHTNWICKSDCIDILSECLDTSRLPPGSTAESICEELSPPQDPSKPCISLSTYLVESPYLPQYSSEVSQPCTPSPCNGSQVCEVRRRKCSPRSHRNSPTSYHRDQSSCLPYICKPGCPMGEVASQLVPKGSYVRIPETGGGASEISRSGGGDCYKMFMCDGHRLKPITHNSLHRLGCSPPGRSQQCLVKPGRIYEHGNLFEHDCNICVCHSTVTSCTNRFCPTLTSTSPSSASSTAQRVRVQQPSSPYTGLPCNCGNEYSAVCANNGQTFHNLCLAECSKYSSSDVERGSCADVDPCLHNPCSLPKRCVKHPRVCIGRNITPAECPQYDCIQLNPCSRRHGGHVRDHICDVTAREHSSICTQLQTGSTIDYWDQCRSGCDEGIDQSDRRGYVTAGRGRGYDSSTVCAVGGDTYRSECSAWGHGRLVDYLGPCKAVGQLLDYPSLQPRCPNVTCPVLQHHRYCQTTTPPGACCPICAGEIRLLINEEPLDEIRRSGARPAITLDELLNSLRHQISMAECDAFGYPSIEGDIVVLVAPITNKPTELQVQVCMSETAKLASLLTSRSPLLTTFIPVHLVTMTTVKTSSLGPLPAFLSSSAAPPRIHRPRFAFLSFFLVIIITNFCLVMPAHHRANCISLINR